MPQVPCFRHVPIVISVDLQRAPGCDMALVHDDDLVAILGAEDVTVSEG